MKLRALLKRNTYYDSITLMALVQSIKALPGVEDAGAVMATAMNLQLLHQSNLYPSEFLAEQSTRDQPEPRPEDLIMVIRASTDAEAETALKIAEERLTSRNNPAQHTTAVGTLAQPPRSLEMAQQRDQNANLAIISVPGEHAWLEAEQALQAGLHVFLFSDNVPIEQELRLKKLAVEKDLLLMGPDCGTAIINGVGLGFSNVVPRGPVGIVGASGTGMQQIVCLLADAGLGVSQAIGTGGRDLSAAIGGLMMLKGLELLASDPQTSVIVLLSKPPADDVARTILAAASRVDKPVVVIFLGASLDALTLPENVALADGLAHGAALAIQLAGRSPERRPRRVPERKAMYRDRKRMLSERAGLAPSQRYIRALYSGGTLCDEAMLVFSKHLGPVFSNVPLRPEWTLPEGQTYKAHTALDLGSDEFTRGRPHPMIDPSYRLSCLQAAAQDPETAVILLDIVLGYCSHPDPASVYAPVIASIRAQAEAAGHALPVVISLCGTEDDPQRLSYQRAQLEAAGAFVYVSNVAAVWVALMLRNPIPRSTEPSND